LLLYQLGHTLSVTVWLRDINTDVGWKLSTLLCQHRTSSDLTWLTTSMFTQPQAKH